MSQSWIGSWDNWGVKVKQGNRRREEDASRAERRSVGHHAFPMETDKDRKYLKGVSE